MEEQKDERLSMINKIVRVRDLSNGIDNSGIISFMYPDFIVKDGIFFDYEHSIIFTGKYKQGLKDELEHGTKEFIALCDSGIPDIDFTQRDIQLQILYGRSKRKVSENTKEVVSNLSEREFWDYFKKYWVTGKSSLDDENNISMFELYKVLGKQKHDIMEVYVKLREVYSDNTIFSSVLSFIEKAQNPDRVSSQNGNYLKMLKDFNATWGVQASKVMQFAYMLPSQTDAESQFRTQYVLLHLGKGQLI